MRHICTLSDYKYLPQGLALLQSLSKTKEPTIVHYLCLDDATYEFLEGSDYTDRFDGTDFWVTPYRHEWIGLKQLRETNYADYCYTCASYFTQMIAHEMSLDTIAYSDSDLFFHKDIKVMYDAFGTADVGIFSHKQFTKEMNRSEGLYNVGFVYFNGKKGMEILDWWANAVLTKEPKHLATCGDQKFLEMFPKLSDKVSIDCVQYQAMWQIQCMTPEEIDNAMFLHASKFKWDDKGYTPSTYHQGYTSNAQVFANPQLKAIFDNYYSVVKSFKI